MSQLVRVWDGMILICEALTSSAPRGREICENPTTTCNNQGKQLTLSHKFSIFRVSWIGYSPLRSKTFMTASRFHQVPFTFLVYESEKIYRRGLNSRGRAVSDSFRENVCLFVSFINIPNVESFSRVVRAWLQYEMNNNSMVCPILAAENIWQLLNVLREAPHCSYLCRHSRLWLGQRPGMTTS